MAYLGLVANRCRMLNTFLTTNKYMMNRTGHIAAVDITTIGGVWSAFYNRTFTGGPSAVADTAIGANATITASIEYPAGTFTQLLFSGSATGTVPNKGILQSDLATLSIPAGATFWVRSWWNSSAGIIYTAVRNAALGDLMNASVGSITDQTMSGTITHNAGSFASPPIAIVGNTNGVSVCLVGDSICAGIVTGTGESEASNTLPYDGKIGILARSMDDLPFLNLGVSSELARDWIANSDGKKLLLPYFSHVIVQLGINDFGASRTPTELQTDIDAIFALLPARIQKWQTTITARSTSTDSWATTTNQTYTGGTNVKTHNTNVRAGIAGLQGYFDLRLALESSPGSDKWAVDGTANKYTQDGLHPSKAGNELVESGGLVDSALLTIPATNSKNSLLMGVG